MSPAVTLSRPAIMRSRVDLPQPDGPTRVTNSLSATSRSILGITSTVPNALRALRIDTEAMMRPIPLADRVGAAAQNTKAHPTFDRRAFLLTPTLYWEASQEDLRLSTKTIL